MGILLLLLIVILAVSITSAYFISKAATKKLRKENIKNAEAWGALIFFLSLIIIGGGIFLLFIFSVPFRR